MPAAIEVSRLVKRYGPATAVDDISFSVQPGEVFALLGPNGAGKTTTVEIIEGLRRPDSGDAAVLGETAGSKSLAPRIGVMPQEGDLWAGIRAEEAIGLFASFYESHEDPDATIERLGLERVRRTMYRRLSGGERRRLSLALALIGRPEVAFLDEPTAGMDVEGRTETWDIVREQRDRGTAVLVTTHLLDEAERIADRVGIIHRGHLVALGSPAELTDRRSRELSFVVAGTIDADKLGSELGSTVVRSEGGAYRIDGVEPDPVTVAKLTQWLAERNVLLRRLDVGARSLEDVYLELTR